MSYDNRPTYTNATNFSTFILNYIYFDNFTFYYYTQ